jgi:hypothetical protein
MIEANAKTHDVTFKKAYWDGVREGFDNWPYRVYQVVMTFIVMMAWFNLTASEGEQIGSWLQQTVAIIDIPRAAVLGFFYFLWVIW